MKSVLSLLRPSNGLILNRAAASDWKIDWGRYLRSELRSSKSTNWAQKKMSPREPNVRFDGRVAIVTGAGGGTWHEKTIFADCKLS